MGRVEGFFCVMLMAQSVVMNEFKIIIKYNRTI